MGDAGHPYDSPFEIEAAWDEPGTFSDDEKVAELTAAQEQSLQCDAQSASVVDEAIAGLFETWAKDHRATIARYKGLLRLG